MEIELFFSKHDKTAEFSFFLGYLGSSVIKSPADQEIIRFHCFR